MIVAFTLFIFALIIGIAVIGRVPATLHTPLMSGANSIHGVVLVGVIIIAASTDTPLGYIIVFFAAILGTMNVVGGYVVTDRMLEMFKVKKTVDFTDDNVINLDDSTKGEYYAVGDLSDSISKNGAYNIEIIEKHVTNIEDIAKAQNFDNPTNLGGESNDK